MTARRALIRRAPPRLAAPLARAFLPASIDAAAVVAEARTWVGVPYLHQGRGRAGVDCAGVPLGVLRALGAPLPELERAEYPQEPPDRYLEERLLAVCTPLPTPTPGALVALRWRRSLAHLAIYTERDTLIHALRRHGTVVEHGFRGLWRTRFAPSYWALPAVRYG